MGGPSRHLVAYPNFCDKLTFMKKLLAIVGPTGTGKTDLALELAKQFNGEIISADSRQIYTGMDIGTGKEIRNSKHEIRKSEGSWVVDGVPIYLYDVIDPDQSFSVAEFQQLAYKKIDEIHKQSKLPILVGGTGLYVRAVIQGLKIPQVQPDKRLRKRFEKKPLGALLKELEEVDPKAYLKVDKSNPRRVIRALEVYYKTGKTLSSLAKKYKPNFGSLIIGLTAPREILYEKADKRIESWFEKGFIDEVKRLLKKYPPSLSSMSSLGYRQVISYLEKKTTLAEAIQRTKFDHHSYIRRQLTWFKKEPNIFWFDISGNSFDQDIHKLIVNWLGNTV